MDPRARPLGSLLRLNTGLYRRALADVRPEDAVRRPNDHVNHLAFLAVHLLEARYFLHGLVGGKAENPFADQLEGARSIDDIERYPPLPEVLAAWDDLATRLDEQLGRVTAAELDAPSPQRFPVDDGSVLGGAAFLVEHEAYHVGQLGYLRKYLGYGSLTGR